MLSIIGAEGPAQMRDLLANSPRVSEASSRDWSLGIRIMSKVNPSNMQYNNSGETMISGATPADISGLIVMRPYEDNHLCRFSVNTL